MLTKLIFISLYIIFIIWLYLFINNRLRFLNRKHIEHSWINYLKTSYKFLSKLITIILVIMCITSIVIYLTFF